MDAIAFFDKSLKNAFLNDFCTGDAGKGNLGTGSEDLPPAEEVRRSPGEVCGGRNRDLGGSDAMTDSPWFSRMSLSSVWVFFGEKTDRTAKR